MIEKIEKGMRIYFCEAWDNLMPTVDEYEVLSIGKVFATLSGRGGRRPWRENLYSVQGPRSRYFTTKRAAILDCIEREKRIIAASERTITRAACAIKAAEVMLVEIEKCKDCEAIDAAHCTCGIDDGDETP